MALGLAAAKFLAEASWASNVKEVLEREAVERHKLDRKIDWVIKRSMIQSYIDKRNTTWNDPRVFMLDLQYHDIRMDRGFYYLLERRGARLLRPLPIRLKIQNDLSLACRLHRYCPCSCDR